MSGTHESKRRPARVSEAAPVQVFLGPADRARLDHLTNQLGTSKSDVLRQSLVALERQLLDPRTHPALRLIGLVDDTGDAVDGVDVARDHDAYLAETHGPPGPRRKRSKPRSPKPSSKRGRRAKS